MYKDVIIIGGGASGLMCAIKVAEKNKNKKIAIIEKQSRIGRKLLSTGNGRCNLTNINLNSSYYHGSFSKYVDVVFENCSAEKVINTLKSYGLSTKVDSEGRVYPYSNHASSVLDILKLKLEKNNIDILLDTNISKIEKKENGFLIKTDDVNYKCKKLVICTGSKASPKLGSDASGLDLLKNLGHKITKLSPALCPVPVDSPFLTALKGVRSNGKVALYKNDILIKEEYGEIQFTENALSGICVFNLSAHIKSNDNYEIAVSLLPNLNDAELLYLLMERKNMLRNYNAENFFTGVFVKALGQSLLKECNIGLARKIASLTNDDLTKLVFAVNNRRFKVLNKLDFNKAQVVSGGVNGNEVNPYTMESKIIKNLYICGEAIDINGDCGGYNLQFAFASGIIAGENI